MIDHVAARRLAATAIDGPLERSEATDLEGHLGECPACRSVSDALARDAATLTHLDFGTVPIAVRADVAIAAERHGQGSPVGRWIGLVAVGSLLIVALGSGALSGVGGRGPADPGGADVGANPIHWQDDGVALQASDFWIQTAAGRFGGTASQPQLRTRIEPDSRVVDVAWGENGTNVGNLRLFLVDIAGGWWVKGVQVSDQSTGDWFDGQGAFVGAPIGTGEVGDVDLDLLDTTRSPVRVVGHVHLGSFLIKVAPPPAVDPNMPVPAPPGTKPTDANDKPPVPVATDAPG